MANNHGIWQPAYLINTVKAKNIGGNKANNGGGVSAMANLMAKSAKNGAKIRRHNVAEMANGGLWLAGQENIS